jgi:hypothetical protein
MEFIDFLEKISFFECNRTKTVLNSNVFHYLKNVKIANKSLKIGQFPEPILNFMFSESTCSGVFEISYGFLVHILLG